MPSVLRVRITADGKGRYTLQLKSQFFIKLKQTMVVIMEGSFMLHNNIISLYILTQTIQKRKYQQDQILLSLFPEGPTYA